MPGTGHRSNCGRLLTGLSPARRRCSTRTSSCARWGRRFTSLQAVTRVTRRQGHASSTRSGSRTSPTVSVDYAYVEARCIRSSAHFCWLCNVVPTRLPPVIAGWDRARCLAVASAFPELVLQQESEQRPHKVSFTTEVGAERGMLLAAELGARLQAEGLRAKARRWRPVISARIHHRWIMPNPHVRP